MTIVEFLRARLDELEAFATEAREAMPRVQPSETDAWRRYFGVVLRDIEAKRRILEIHDTGADPCDAHDASFESIPCETMLLLALPYVDHPDYDPLWRLAE